MKAVLVMKNMPTRCADCICFADRMVHASCKVINREVAEHEIWKCKPSWCPLKEDNEQEIRNKAIEEFKKAIVAEYDNDACPNVTDYLDYKLSIRELFEIAESMKGEKE